MPIEQPVHGSRKRQAVLHNVRPAGSNGPYVRCLNLRLSTTIHHAESRHRASVEVGDYHTARRLIAGMRASEEVRAEEFNGTNVTGVKSALAIMGHDCGHTRCPSAWPLTGAQSAKLRAFLERENLLQ